MTPEVSADEIAFSMTLFVSVANGRLGAGWGAGAESAERDDDVRCEQFFRALAMPQDGASAEGGDFRTSPLYRATLALWRQYRGNAQRESIVARVLGFCFLVERTRGAILEGWCDAPGSGEELVTLHPAVVEALAEAPLDGNQILTLNAFCAQLDRVAQRNATLPAEPRAEAAWPAGPSEMARLMRLEDWSPHPLGEAAAWPQSLRTAIDLTLACQFPMIVLWGRDLAQFYNDAYRNIMGVKHPAGLGQATAACWPEVWRFNQPVYARVLDGESITFEDQLFPIVRYGFLEEAYFTLCYSPLREESGAIAGVLVTVFETTQRVRGRTKQVSSTETASGQRKPGTVASSDLEAAPGSALPK